MNEITIQLTGETPSETRLVLCVAFENSSVVRESGALLNMDLNPVIEPGVGEHFFKVMVAASLFTHSHLPSTHPAW